MNKNVLNAIKAALEAHNPHGVDVVYRLLEETSDVVRTPTAEEFDRVAAGLLRVKGIAGANTQFDGFTVGVLELLWRGFAPRNHHRASST